jgi:hypothetical protein
MPACAAAGEYRAPKSRTNLSEYWWFCLEHVRAYNSAWDYYKGMSPGEIETELRRDTAWQRPSWPLGSLGASAWEDAMARDPLGLLNAGRLRRGRASQDDQAPPAELRDPLATLGLSWPVTFAAVKTRYKELAKRHHPDANGGDKAAEERIKTINLAYAALRTRLADEPASAAAAD